MDSASHFVIGLGLAGLAHMMPGALSTPGTEKALLIAAVIASEAPDFDYAVRLKGEAVYVKNHRGFSHSIIAWFIWPTLITGGLALFFHGLPWYFIWFWSFIAVLAHVGVDVFNTLGTQALLPFSRKRISIDALPLLDPFIFIIQSAGIMLWWTRTLPPGPLFACIDALAGIYIAVRVRIHRRLKERLQEQFRGASLERISVSPKFRLNRWAVVIETKKKFILGKIESGRFKISDRLDKGHPDRDWQALKQKSLTLDTFFDIARHIHIRSECVEAAGLVRYILTDFRFVVPFNVVIEMNPDGDIVKEYFGSVPPD